MHWSAGHDKECDKGWETTECIWSNDLDTNERKDKRYLHFEVENAWDRKCERCMEYSNDCPDCRKTSDCSAILVVGCEYFIDKIRNGNDIVAPKKFMLRIDYQLSKSYLLEIKRATVMTCKKMIVCNIYRRIYEKDFEQKGKEQYALHEIAIHLLLVCLFSV